MYPSMEEAQSADRLQLAKWWRFLPSAETKETQAVQRVWQARFEEMGMFTPAISKQIGLEP